MTSNRPALDDFEIRRTTDTAGIRFADGKGRVILHNHREPCHNAERLERYVVKKLGAEVPPRPELKRLCYVCDFPEGAETALRRGVRAHRRDPNDDVDPRRPTGGYAFENG